MLACEVCCSLYRATVTMFSSSVLMFCRRVNFYEIHSEANDVSYRRTALQLQSLILGDQNKPFQIVTLGRLSGDGSIQ